MIINKNKAGLVMGIFFGFFHLLWSGGVALGFAQPMLDFVYRIHFLSNPMVVAPFGLKRLVALLVITTLVGYIAGWVLAWLFNKVHKQA